MNNIISKTTLFAKPGKSNTDQTLQLALEKSRELSISTVLVASTTGSTAKKALDILKDLDIVVITHAQGYLEPNLQEFSQEGRIYVESNGGKILTAQHSFGGVNRAIKNSLGSIQVDEIIANVFRLFGQGMKVAVEMAMMAADTGTVPCGQPVITVSGTHRGADFGSVLIPANSCRMFDLQILEIFCMPSPQHPSFHK